MGEFFADLGRSTLLQHALITGIAVSIACGMIGSYVVTRRITYIAGGVAHCTLGGMGAARYLQVVHDLDWLHPLYGALVAALAAALIIGWVTLRARQREDTVISALWAIGMAVGVLFIAGTPAANAELMSYLFGDILLVSQGRIQMIIILDVVVVALAFLLHNKFMAVCFDEEFARLRGIKVEFYYLLLLSLTALTVVLLVSVVGLILVIALLTLPVAIAGNFVHRMSHLMVLAALISMVLTTGGLVISYTPGLPVGATIVALAGGLYLVVLSGRRLLKG